MDAKKLTGAVTVRKCKEYEKQLMLEQMEQTQHTQCQSWENRRWSKDVTEDLLKNSS